MAERIGDDGAAGQGVGAGIGVGGTLLLVEDDLTISDLLAYNLRRAGYDVQQERNGRAGVDAALRKTPDLVLMDLMLPGLDGISASREIKRHHPDLPIIILTARGERDMQLQGFEAGADDYVTKPFDMDVLLARIQARLRGAPTTPTPAPARETIGNLTLDHQAHTVHSPRGEIDLTPKERDLLLLLVSQPGRLFTREEIVEAVWHHRYMAGSRTLDVHVRRLRAALEEADAGLCIQTVRGVGYRLAVAAEKSPGPT